MKMTTTTYYNLNIVEGTDIVNPLTVDNPNYEKIDETMHNNAVAGVTLATEIANATVHAITRENSDCAVIRFIATSRWKAGDTATVDGVPVTALLPSGETLPDGAYVINANVLCILTGTNLTVYLGSKKAENANEIPYNDTTVGAELTKINSDLDLDFSNASVDVQDVKTLLQNLLNRFYPNVVSEIINGLSRLTASSSDTTWVYSEETFDISRVDNALHLAFTVVSPNGKVWLYGIKGGVPTTLDAKDDGWSTSYNINRTINRSQYDSIKVKIGAFGAPDHPSTTSIQNITCELL